MEEEYNLTGFDASEFRNQPKPKAKPGQQFIILRALRGTKRTTALLDSETRVRLFTSRAEADKAAVQCGGKVVDAETLEAV